jgi:hypothetical protein
VIGCIAAESFQKPYRDEAIPAVFLAFVDAGIARSQACARIADINAARITARGSKPNTEMLAAFSSPRHRHVPSRNGPITSSFRRRTVSPES